MDQLAREGVTFHNCFATSPWTLPSHLSLFTSTEPGKFFQAVAQFTDAPYPAFFSHQEDAPTIASVLRQRGYDTVAYHGALFVDAVWGLDHGFRNYEYVQSDEQFVRAADYVREQARGDRPFFLFVHTYAIHRPYKHEAVFGSPAERPPGLREMDFVAETLAGDTIVPLEADAPLYGWQPTAEEVEYFKTVYDGGVRFADGQLQLLIDALKQASLYDDALIVAVSDHGEEFWEHFPENSPGHDHSLFDELLRIPLILKLPGGQHAGTAVDELARIHDVGPTVFEVAGVPPPGGSTGRNLLPLLQNGTVESRVLYAGCTYRGPMRHCVRNARYKYIECPQTVSFKPHIDVPERALYDLISDPAEQANIVARQPDVAASLREELHRRRQSDLPFSLALDDMLTLQYLPALGLEAHAEWLAREGRPPAVLPQVSDLGPGMLERLRALGYIR